MKLPSYTQILYLHKQNIHSTGGSIGILYDDQLKSFIDQLHFFVKYSDDLIDVATWILLRLIQNHYFVDGNKRTALSTMIVFLKSNNCRIKVKSDENLYNLTLDIASSTITEFIDARKILENNVICN